MQSRSSVCSWEISGAVITENPTRSVCVNEGQQTASDKQAMLKKTHLVFFHDNKGELTLILRIHMKPFIQSPRSLLSKALRQSSATRKHKDVITKGHKPKQTNYNLFQVN